MIRAALLLVLAVALMAPLLAQGPEPDTVAGCATDWECENGPDPADE